MRAACLPRNSGRPCCPLPSPVPESVLMSPTPSSEDPNPHWGLGSAGMCRACRPGQWGGLVPPPGSGGGQASGSQERPSGQNHCPSEDGVLGAASSRHLSLVCTLCGRCAHLRSCVCAHTGHWVSAPVTAPTCAVLWSALSRSCGWIVCKFVECASCLLWWTPCCQCVPHQDVSGSACGSVCFGRAEPV